MAQRHEVKCSYRKLVVVLLISNVLSLLMLVQILSSGSRTGMFPAKPRSPTTTQQGISHLRANNDNAMAQQTSLGYTYQPHPHVFGFVHIAKTAGSYINSYLAAHYKRVCGDKGNSYDSAALYRRVNDTIHSHLDHYQQPCQNVQCNYGDDIIRRTYQNGYGRARVPFEVMKEVGFEDCDYIALEIHAEDWEDVASTLGNEPPLLGSIPDQEVPSSNDPNKNVKLELHVPCRDPIDHLLSQCNHGRKAFPCTATSVSELNSLVDDCMFGHRRFDSDLWMNNPVFQLKCFDVSSQLDTYLVHMFGILQPRRHIVEEYISLASNEPR
eukprot:Nitzschia sp. Nitz4//scaffold118_size93875//71218//72320//NITZ4_004797-RA/size93875-exonerate_est2genome-gene-0.71-mRNA-1//1//CDS//3329533751//6660//frame0